MSSDDNSFGRPYQIHGFIQHYEWGARNEESFIPPFLGIETEKGKPYAELWLGAHPKAPSLLEEGAPAKTLDAFIAKFPEETLGKEVAKKFNNKLPFLLKVLSAAEALSIQAHPNKEQAIELHARDPEHYPDDNHKPEIAIALDELKALVGFRTVKEICQQCKDIPELGAFVDPTILNNLQKSVSQDKDSQIACLKAFYTHFINKTEEQSDTLQDTLNQISQRIGEGKTSEEKLFSELRKKYRDADIGLLSIFLLNLITLKPGQGIFLKAGIPHAYLKGNIIECMANSDNVVRAGLTPKFKDSQTLVDILTYENGIPEIFEEDSSLNSYTYPVDIPDFKISIHRSLNTKLQCGSFQIWLVCEGQLKISHDREEFSYSKGQSFILTPALQPYQITCSKESLIFQVDIPAP